MLFNRIVILVMTAILAFVWICPFFIGGIMGVISWWGIMAGSILGIIISFILVILLLVKFIRRKKVTRHYFMMLALFFIMALPFSWFLNIGHIAFPAKIETTEPAVSINLPLNETLVVGWGGDDLESNQPHAIVPNERWAYDLLIEPYSNGSKNLNDYGIYNKEIESPVKGTIVGVYDKEKDITPGSEENETMIGNYIYIKIEETETYLVLSHIKQNSALVKNGQNVDEGTPLAKVGNSGSSSEPHLHIHHQRQNPATTNLFLSEGLPLYFKNIDGNSMPKGGENPEIISPKRN
ncbi:M23 family metallopeptidase [Gracilibacillus saliphilus]|uniref:M23 family metallopeptidase n=1 Tax=Gracilibacillus saliphilus TaxID=543890 RepID=UPI0013CFFCEC|nr:M23 family metallopeptidase [Gracilibacillus saliphilus]